MWRCGSTFTYLWLPFMILPIFAGLERIPTSLLEASADLGGRGWMTFRRVILPLVDPGRRGRLDLHVLADARRLHRPRPGLDARSSSAMSSSSTSPRICRWPRPIRWSHSRSCSSTCSSRAGSAPSRRSDADRSDRTGWRFGRRPAWSSPSSTSRSSLVVIYAFNESGTSAWPPSGFTLKWVGEALAQHRAPASVPDLDRVALWARPLVAMVLGALAALAVARYSFFGRETISFVVILAIALPGIVTGMALSTTFATFARAARVLHDRHRARDVLHRARLQQRDREAAQDRRSPSRRLRLTSAPTPSRRSVTSRSRPCVRR